MISYKELLLCKEKVILKDARIRKNLTLNWENKNSRFYRVFSATDNHSLTVSPRKEQVGVDLSCVID